MSLRIFYKCQCMPVEDSVIVPERGDGEDIGDWINEVRAVITTDHRKRSLLCVAQTMEWVKIPHDGKGIVGR